MGGRGKRGGRRRLEPSTSPHSCTSYRSATADLSFVSSTLDLLRLLNSFSIWLHSWSRCLRSTIQELLSLRRFRAQASGLALDKLNRGEVKRRKAKAKAEDEEEDGEDDGEPKVVAGLVQGKGTGKPEDEYVPLTISHCSTALDAGLAG